MSPDFKKPEADVLADKEKFSRRDFLRGVAPAGALGALAYTSHLNERANRQTERERLGFDPLSRTGDSPSASAASTQNFLNIGIIGVGLRGKDILKAAGFAQPDQLKENEELGTTGQTALQIRLTAVCDLFQPNLEWGVRASGGKARAYGDYQELLEDPEIDAVIIAVPDHWHAPITIDAASLGKHIYVEKCFTHTFEEAVQVRRKIKESKVVLQLGHQSRSNPAHSTAGSIVSEGLLGRICLVQTYTNRNTPDGAWIYDIPRDAGPHNIDWNRFLGNAPRVEFDLKRFFEWRRYWDYGTGLSGDMFTHQWDAVDQILDDVGLPATASASGGIYYWTDGREVPDVYNVVYEYPDKGLSLAYSACLSSSLKRGKAFLGSDGSMDMTTGIVVRADRNSKRYKDRIESGDIDIDRPILSYMETEERQMEAITSPSQQWTIGKGILYTLSPEGRLVNLTYLHLRNWLDAIRNGTRANCHEDIAFREAVTAHMGTLSLKWGCRVRWDGGTQTIVRDLEGESAV